MLRILVIDDQRDVRAMVSIMLRVNHFEVVEAAGQPVSRRLTKPRSMLRSWTFS